MSGEEEAGVRVPRVREKVSHGSQFGKAAPVHDGGTVAESRQQINRVSNKQNRQPVTGSQRFQ